MMIVRQTSCDPQFYSKRGKLLMLTLIGVFDPLLLGTVLLIMGVSLCTLFVDTRMTLPGWPQANSVDDLEISLVAVVRRRPAPVVAGPLAMVDAWRRRACYS